jgi:methyltransferase type 12
MRKMYQTEWFGIKFSDFCKMDSEHIADDKFYKKFYDIFYDKFHSYDELPKDYKKDKLKLAKELILFAKDYDRLLSIGCGNGIIEDFILKNTDKKILVLEPSNNARWLQTNENCKVVVGFFPQCLADEEKYDFGYCSMIDYVFNDEQYLNFMKSICDYEFKEFYLMHLSVPKEKLMENIVVKVKDIIKNILFVVTRGEYCRGQFWGYLRSIDEHILIMKKAGFKNINYGKHGCKSYWIRVKNEKN